MLRTHLSLHYLASIRKDVARHLSLPRSVPAVTYRRRKTSTQFFAQQDQMSGLVRSLDTRRPCLRCILCRCCP